MSVSKVNEYTYLSNSIGPDEIQINTPLRRCNAESLTEKDILRIKDDFICACKNVNIVSVFDKKVSKIIDAVSDGDTLKRRGKIK